ncbi:hypothetical protein NP493_1829g00018 [Ridgeia piscesae]|uniref:Uncharacterized protein n=1 Tax=Ridgeia piscesae TaxID=27915 RepID=A0AAD9JRD2_RIDPI|nr:hypothetical protein NP493_1829g00018 [Ridgeia piscesae]
MFPATSNTAETSAYDFYSEENAPKWKGLFVSALQKVQRQVHSSLSAKGDALEYIEGLILQLLGMLCASQPHTWTDVEHRVGATFPSAIQTWAHNDAKRALEKGKKRSTLVLPVDKIHALLVKEVLGYKIDYQVSMYIAAVLEYIAADILKLTGNYVKNIKHQEITLQDIKVAMCADKVLMNMFFQDDDDAFTLDEEPRMDRRGSLTYEVIVKDLILEETQYIRDLKMIIKVFREPFAKLFPGSKDLEVIFSNILDLYELTVKLLSSLEDTIEVTEENAVPLVGVCFEELIEGAEFDVYEKFADDMLKPNGRERLNTLLQRSDCSLTCQSAGHGFREAVKYVLPKLLLGPVYHSLYYFDVIKKLIEMSDDEDDQECLHTVQGILYQIKVEIERKLNVANQLKRKLGETTLRFQGRAEREAALTKMAQLQKSIDGWEGKNIGQSCNECVIEGTLMKYAGRRFAERYVFLFDGLIILTKQNTKRSSVTGPVGDYKLKEKFNIRKVDVADREDSEEVKNSFEIQVRDHPSIILVAKNAEEKNNWMAALISLLTRSMLERMLDSKLSEEEKQQPLRLPPPDQYRFAIEDSDENIVFEDNQDRAESPLIKGGTLLKLVERLTYHMYADPKFVRTFLTTYRTFCKPEELLDHLIERFEIPDPPVHEAGPSMQEDCIRDDLKRFRKEYSKPVQFRVLNVLRHWVDQHWYDFEGNQDFAVQTERISGNSEGQGHAKVGGVYRASHQEEADRE